MLPGPRGPRSRGVGLVAPYAKPVPDTASQARSAIHNASTAQRTASRWGPGLMPHRRGWLQSPIPQLAEAMSEPDSS
eukprot:3347177-Rhodomonas_salina.2